MEKDILKSLETLHNGGVILYPTDTIWGLGCDATNDSAIQKIYQIKQRVASKSMIVLLDTVDKISNYVKNKPTIVSELVRNAKKPLTIIYDDAKNLPQSIIAEDNSIAIRITNEAFSKELCKRFGKPIVSTSANISGINSPLFFDEIDRRIIEKVDYVVDFRQNDKQKYSASSIIKLEGENKITIIRE